MLFFLLKRPTQMCINHSRSSLELQGPYQANCSVFGFNVCFNVCFIAPSHRLISYSEFVYYLVPRLFTILTTI
jgi:hypothetical protein